MPTIINGTDNTAATPALTGTDTDTGVFFPAANTMAFSTGGTERVRVDSSGNIGIGTTAPTSIFNIYNATSTSALVQGDAATNTIINRASTDTSAPVLVFRKSRGTIASPTTVASGDIVGSVTFQGYGGTTNRTLSNIQSIVDTYTSDSNISSYMIFGTSPSGSATTTERMRIDSSGNLLFNSGYGSVATAYGCRAWVNFDGTTNVGGFCTIRASGGVTSITDNGTGDYTINFSFTFPDANYAVVVGGGAGIDSARIVNSTARAVPTTTAARFKIQSAGGSDTDAAYAYAAVFR